MALLHEAVGLGYRSPDAFRTEAALDPLRARADFRILMLDLSFPARASVGSTDASARLLARVGVVGPTRATRLAVRRLGRRPQ